MESGQITNREGVKPFSAAVWHRIFGCAAVLHAAILFGSLRLLAAYEQEAPAWVLKLWVGLSALWFVWPLVLALHRGQSAGRVLIPLAVAAPFVFLWYTWWSTIWGPSVFGLPEMLTISPLEMARYVCSYSIGWTEATVYTRYDDFVLEGYGFGFSAPRSPNFSKHDRDACGIELRSVAGCVVNTAIVGHANGWNDATMAALRRHCPAVVKRAEDDAARLRRSWDDGDVSGRADAEADAKAGRLVVEVADRVSNAHADQTFERVLRDNYHLGFRRVDLVEDPNELNRIWGHQHGYEIALEKEVKRRFGKKAVDAIWDTYFKDRPLH